MNGPLLVLKVKWQRKIVNIAKTTSILKPVLLSLELAKKAINEGDSWTYKCKKEEKKTEKTKIFSLTTMSNTTTFLLATMSLLNTVPFETI